MKRFLMWMGLVIGALILWWAAMESAEGAVGGVVGTGPGVTPGSPGALSVLSTGSGDVSADILTATATGVGFGYTFNNQGTFALWEATGAGTGTNVWRGALNFYDGVTAFGNPVWRNLGEGYGSQGFYWGYGPEKSETNTSWPSGLYNGISVQPGLQVVNANPWAGGAWIGVRSGFTNSTHGQLVGNTKQGTPIYVSQFGMQMFQISDAYFPNATTLGRESQQSPSENFLFNDSTIDVYWSMNGQRGGDTYVGQVPLMLINTSLLGVGHPIWSIPLQTANVWMMATNAPNGTPTTNTAYQSAFQVDGATGQSMGQAIDAKKVLHVGGGGARGSLGAVTYGFQDETNGFYKCEDGAWAYDSIDASRLAIVKKSGAEPGIYAGNTAAIHLGHSSAADFSQTAVSAMTLTDQIQIDAGLGNNFLGRSNFFNAHITFPTNLASIAIDSTLPVTLLPTAISVSLTLANIDATGKTVQHFYTLVTNSAAGTITLTMPPNTRVTGSTTVTRVSEIEWMQYGKVYTNAHITADF